MAKTIDMKNKKRREAFSPEAYIDITMHFAESRAYVDNLRGLEASIRSKIEELEKSGDKGTEYWELKLKLVGVRADARAKERQLDEKEHRIKEYENKFKRDFSDIRRNAPAILKEAKEILAKTNEKNYFYKEIDSILCVFEDSFSEEKAEEMLSGSKPGSLSNEDDKLFLASMKSLSVAVDNYNKTLKDKALKKR